MNINWNAKGYKTDFSFVHKYGEDVLELLNINVDDEILDLGCGNGALSKKISDMGGKVVGMDASEEMLKTARNDYENIDFYKADAANFTLADLNRTKPFDKVFSNAVFHWVDDQNALLRCINSALKKGGILVCEFGGYGCAETVHSALEKAFEKRGLNYKRTFYFPTIGEYTPIMEKNGFMVNYALLFDRFTQLKGENGLLNWINMFDKAPFGGVDENIAEKIKSEAVENCRNTLYKNGSWYCDYVRIRLRAEKI